MLLTVFVGSLVSDFCLCDRYGTASSYHSTLCSVISYTRSLASDTSSPRLSEVFTRDFLSGYQNWLVSSGLRWNTVSFYMRVLQGVYHRALEHKLVDNTPRLFSSVFTGNDVTIKRALSSDTIRLLRQADLSDDSRLGFCRDMFMLSFYLHGVAFVDMAFLRKSCLHDGILTYHRRKSGSSINTPVCREAMEIIHRYEHLTSDSPYLLPIILEPGHDEYHQYQNALRTHNRRLKRLASHLGIADNLTSYVSRHSWATIAHHSGVPTAIISQALGHRSESVTRIYLAGFDTEILNNATLTILSQLNSDNYNEKGKNKNVFLCGRERHLTMQT